MGLFARMRQATSRHDASPRVPSSSAADRLDVQLGDRPASSIPLDEAIFCVIDIETTGVQPGVDRIVELAVVRCDAHGRVIDQWHTLIHPQRAMDAEWVHGIDDHMVAGAPAFVDVAARLMLSLDGAVFVAHNASFDHRFVSAELREAGYDVALPYLCTMHARRHVGLPAPVTHRLAWACWHAGKPIYHAHAAMSDARATASLLDGYLTVARHAGHATLQRLAATAAAANACAQPVLRVNGDGGQLQLRPRPLPAPPSPVLREPPVDAAELYQQAVGEAVEDFKIDGHEIDQLHQLVLQLGLPAEKIAGAHRRFVQDRLENYLADDELSWEEHEQIRLLARLLAVDPRWLNELVGDRRPLHPALVLDAAHLDASREAPGDDGLEDTGPELLAAPLSVCFTGPFEAIPMTRTEVHLLATDAGMRVRPGVSIELDVLVCQDPHAGTGKLRKAEAQGTVVIDQYVFLALAGAATPTPAPTGTVLAEIAARRRARAAAPPRPKRAATRSRAAAGPAVKRSDPAVGEQVLWCGPGAHQWRRPPRRGRPPKRCPEH